MVTRAKTMRENRIFASTRNKSLELPNCDITVANIHARSLSLIYTLIDFMEFHILQIFKYRECTRKRNTIAYFRTT